MKTFPLPVAMAEESSSSSRTGASTIRKAGFRLSGLGLDRPAEVSRVPGGIPRRAYRNRHSPFNGISCTSPTYLLLFGVGNIRGDGNVSACLQKTKETLPGIGMRSVLYKRNPSPYVEHLIRMTLLEGTA
jgi:hypothetical protein